MTLAQREDRMEQHEMKMFLYVTARAEALHYAVLTKYKDDTNWDFASYLINTFIGPSLAKCRQFLEEVPREDTNYRESVLGLQKELKDNCDKLDWIKNPVVMGQLTNILMHVIHVQGK